MSETARIESIAELRAFRVALLKFVDACNVALGDADSDMQRTFTWMERDQLTFWNVQLTKRAEMVTRAREAVRMKKLYKSPTGATQSAVEEEKALRVAIRMYEEAEQKIAACKQWARRLQKEIMMYKGGVTRFTSLLGGDIPRALAKLDAMAGSLEAYATLAAGAGGASGAGAPAGAFSGENLSSMARSADAAPTKHAGVLDIAALRDSVPPPDVRAATPAGDIPTEPWTLPPISADARKTVAQLVRPMVPVSKDDTFIVAKGASSSPRVFLERRAPAIDKDSGWYVAPADVGGIVALSRVPVRDLLDVRPDFYELLSLPESYLIVLGAGGIQSIFTPHGDDLWAGKPTATG